MTTIREDAATIGYHDELSIDLEYSWEEPQENFDEPTSVSKRWHTRSTTHAIEGLLFGPRVTPKERREAAGTAAGILQNWQEGVYDRHEVDFDAWDRTPVETSAETRTLDFDTPPGAEITATRIEECEGMKDMDAAEYCGRVVATYIDDQIDHDLWHEKPYEVRDILERNGNTFLAELVETYADQPKLTIGSNIYTEHVAPEEAETPEEYLDGLEKERFQPI